MSLAISKGKKISIEYLDYQRDISFNESVKYCYTPLFVLIGELEGCSYKTLVWKSAGDRVFIVQSLETNHIGK